MGSPEVTTQARSNGFSSVSLSSSSQPSSPSDRAVEEKWSSMYPLSLCGALSFPYPESLSSSSSHALASSSLKSSEPSSSSSPSSVSSSEDQHSSRRLLLLSSSPPRDGDLLRPLLPSRSRLRLLIFNWLKLKTPTWAQFYSLVLSCHCQTQVREWSADGLFAWPRLGVTGFRLGEVLKHIPEIPEFLSQCRWL